MAVGAEIQGRRDMVASETDPPRQEGLYKDALQLDARHQRQCTMQVQRQRGHRLAATLLDAGGFRETETLNALPSRTTCKSTCSNLLMVVL